jgi:hypothetical protein
MAWWTGIAAAQTTVECAGQTHRARWSDGELRLLDHDDAEGERALAALGGPRCACVDLLDAWERHRRDLRVLVLAGRGPTDLLASRGDGPAHGRPGPAGWIAGTRGPRPSVRGGAVAMMFGSVVPRGGPASSSSPRPASSSSSPRPASSSSSPRPASSASSSIRLPRPGGAADRELIGLLDLGGDLPARLQATVIAAWAARIADADHSALDRRPELTAALYGRVATAVRSWLGRADLRIELAEAAGGSPPCLARASPDRLRVELPFAWLEAVWSRGLATVMGRFCLEATTTDGVEWTLSTVGPDFGPAEPITLRLARPTSGGR